MAEKIPKVLLLKPFRPDQTAADAVSLQYPHMEDAEKKHRPHTAARWENFLTANEPLEEEAAARNLASQYLLQTALKATTVASQESRELWADRFTESSIEFYGAPDNLLASQLFAEQVRELKVNSDTGVEYPDFVNQWIDQLPTKSTGEPEVVVNYEEVAHILQGELEQRYKAVFELFDAISDGPIQPTQIAEIFTDVRDVLAQSDPEWSEWEVELIDNDKLSAGNGKINVGIHRVSAEKNELKGLVAHEILVHVQRAINGKKISPGLKTGLPGYLDAEEGLGVFFEYAVTGKIPDKIIDRYVDTAAALGGVFDHPLTRQELFELALARKQSRDGVKLNGSPDEVGQHKEIWGHVNRIYRGSRGDNHVGVFTKDIAYFEGFRLIGDYISAQLKEGKSIGDVVDYMLLGKFDPTKESHKARLQNDLELRSNQ